MRARAALVQVWDRMFAHEDCPKCKGTGRFVHEGMIPLTCDDCNGTGIKGDARLGAVVMLVVFMLTVVLPLYLWLR